MSAETTQITNQQDSSISNALPTRSNVKVLSQAENGDLYLKVFLLGSDRNGNNWGIDQSTVEQNIKTAIGKPLVIYQDRGDEPDRIRFTPYGKFGSWPRRKGEFNHPPWDEHSKEHTYEMLKPFTVGQIKNIAKNQETGDFWGMVKITDEGLKRIFKENPTLPFYVSPQLWRLNKDERSIIKTWELTHLAIVSRPAFGVRATVQGSCSGDAESCTSHFLNASLADLPRDESGTPTGCGFCTYKAMKEVAEQTLETERTGRTIYDMNNIEDTSHLTNSSNIKTEERLSDNNNTNSSVSAGTPNATTISENVVPNGRVAQDTERNFTIEHKTYPSPETHTYRPNAPQPTQQNNTNNNAPNQDKLALIARIEQEKAERQKALQQLKVLARDNQELAGKASKYESELAQVKSYIQAQQAAAREDGIAQVVYSANLADLVPEDKKEEAIKLAISKGLEPNDVSKFLSPLYEAFDAYIQQSQRHGNGNPITEQVPQFNTPNPGVTANASLNRREARLRLGGNNNSTGNAYNASQQNVGTPSFSTEPAFIKARKMMGMYTPPDSTEVTQ